MRYVSKGFCALLLLTGVFFFATVSQGTGDFLIIAHPGVIVDSLPRSTVADIYKGHRVKWDDGQRIKVVMLKKGVTHEAFVKSMLQLSSSKLKSLWKKVIFSGSGTPPKILRLEDECVKYVAATEGAIGYISPGTEHGSIKIITVR